MRDIGNSTRLFAFATLVFPSLLAISLPIASAQAPPRATIELENARWQQMPEHVLSVYTGPDGRIWHHLFDASNIYAPVALRKRLETEYREQSPQIVGASLALLEPGGRVWFFVNRSTELWGFDGKSWVERKPPPGEIFLGLCPTAGELLDNVHNRFVAGKAYFRDTRGVHVFDGTQWIYEAIVPPARQQIAQVRYAVSPNGRYAVALAPQLTADGGTVQTMNLWVVEEGAWKQRSSPWLNNLGWQNTIGPFCVDDDGIVWYVWQYGALRSLRLNDQTNPAELITQLNHDDFQTREQASAQLAGLLARNPAVIRPQLEAAYKSAVPLEVKFRLQTILGQPTTPRERLAKTITPGNANMVPIGKCRMQGVKALFHDDQGRLFVFAAAIQGRSEPPVRGLAILDRRGNAEIFPLRDEQAGIQSQPLWVSPPVQDKDRRGLWVSGEITGGPLRHLEYASKKVENAPDNQGGKVHAVDAQGRLYLSGGTLDVTGRARTRVTVIDSRVADTRQKLASFFEPITWPETLVAGDGAVWAIRKGAGLSRFDGVRWERMYDSKQPQCIPTLAGENGVVLCRNRQGDLLFQDTEFIAQAPLQQLIADHRDIIAAAFPPRGDGTLEARRNWITTDTRGNIWLLEHEKLSVLSNGEWLNAQEPLKALGQKLGGARFLSPIGEGNRVFVSDMSLLSSGGKSFFAEVSDGQIKLSDALHSTNRGLRDGAGGLWLEEHIAKNQGSSDRTLLHHTVRLVKDGTREDLDHYEGGRPVLVDKSDNVWLQHMKQLQPGNRFSIWRHGRLIQELTLTEVSSVRELFCDRPSSVYAVVPRGLLHLVSKQVDGREQFQAEQFYATDAPSGQWSYSSLGFLVVSAYYGGQRELHFIKLPASE